MTLKRFKKIILSEKETQIDLIPGVMEDTNKAIDTIKTTPIMVWNICYIANIFSYVVRSKGIFKDNLRGYKPTKRIVRSYVHRYIQYA